jgi:hypothetical protein
MGQYFASCLPGCMTEVPPIPAVTTRGSQLTLRANSRLMRRSKMRLLDHLVGASEAA